MIKHNLKLIFRNLWIKKTYSCVILLSLAVALVCSNIPVDSAFFSLFDFPLLQGRKNDCLTPGRIVLSKEKALVLFGKADIVGNEVTIITPDTTQQLKVALLTLSLQTIKATMTNPVDEIRNE
jgi:hypothetical protein